MATRNDEPFGRLLKKTLDSQAGRGGRDCPDAEILAAYREDALSPAARRREEEHLAACLRCQQELAALAAIEEEEIQTSAPVTTRAPWFARPRLRWLAPLAAGATAVLALSIAIRLLPQAERERRVAEISARRERADELERSADLSSRESRTNPRAEIREEAPQVAEPNEKSAEAAPTIRLGEALRRQPPVAKLPAAPSVSAAPPRRDGEGALHDRSAAKAPRSGKESDVAAFALGSAPPPLVVASPGGSVLWRFGEPSLAYRSVDGGRSWQPAPCPAAENVVAATCLSDTICWAVGRKGTVLRTTDGTSWQKTALPTGDDLVGVSAVDGSSATVKTARRGELRTGDGGVSWEPAAVP